MTTRRATAQDLYGGRDPRDFPAYGVREVARYLRVPDATLRAWVVGRPYPARGQDRWFEPLIRPADAAPIRLSFLNAVEAFVLSSMRRHHGVRMARVREALEFVEERLRVERPLAHEQFQTDGVDLFVERANALIVASRAGQMALAEVMRAHLRRVSFDAEGLAAQFFPFARVGADLEQPRFIVMDPLLAYGRPVMAGTGVPTAVVARRFLAGESPEALAEDCLS